MMSTTRAGLKKSAKAPISAPTSISYTQLAASAFKNALAGKPAVEESFRLAGKNIRLSFAGDSLKKSISPLLAAFPRAAGPDDLHVRLWDTASTGIDAPRLPAEKKVFGPEIEIYFHADSGVLTAFDAGTREAFWWTRDAAALPFYEKSAPLRTLFGVWGRTNGLCLAHAGAVGTDRGGVVFVGKGGSGKSTCALACLGADFDYAGDDYVLLGHNVKTPKAFGIYATAKLEAGNLARLPFLSGVKPEAFDPERNKVLLPINGALRQRMAPAIDIRAVILPRVSGVRKSRLVKISKGEALRALAPSTLFQSRDARHGDLAFMAAFVRGLHSYILEMGPDPSDVPPLVQAMLEKGDNP